MGDRTHLRRQGELSELEEWDDTFSESPAYNAVPNKTGPVSQLKLSVFSAISFTPDGLPKLTDFLAKIGGGGLCRGLLWHTMSPRGTLCLLGFKGTTPVTRAHGALSKE